MVGTRRRESLLGRATLPATAAVLTIALTLTACTNKSDGSPGTGADQVALELTMDGGAGHLSRPARDDVLNGVSQALTTYLREGFLGKYPRDDFVRVLEVFTSDEAPRAAEDLEILTAAGLENTTDLAPRRLDARVTTFAPRGEPSGVSARIDFRFEATDSAGDARGLTVAGRLLLTPERGAWKIFGYDVRNNDDAPLGRGS